MTSNTTTPLHVAAVQNADVLRWLRGRENPGAPVTTGQIEAAVGRDASNIGKGLDILALEGFLNQSRLPDEGRKRGRRVIGLTGLALKALDALDVWEGLAPAGPFPAAAASQAAPHAAFRPDPENPRRKPRTPAQIDELADSIAHKGVLQPILATPAGADGIRTIIAGEGRWLGVGRLIERADPAWPPERGVPYIERDEDEVGRLETALTENIISQKMDPIDEGAGFVRLCQLTGLSGRAAAERIGVNYKTFAERRKVAAEAAPDDIAAYQLGEKTWKDLVASVAAPSPKMLLAMAEIFILADGGRAPIRTDLDQGCLPDLEHRGLVQTNRAATLPNGEAWLTPKGRAALEEADAWTGGGDDAGLLFRFRAPVIGEGPARELERQGRFATRWLVAPESDAAAARAKERAEYVRRFLDKLKPRQLLMLVELADKVQQAPIPGRGLATQAQWPPSLGHWQVSTDMISGGVSLSAGVAWIDQEALDWLADHDLNPAIGDRHIVLGRARAAAGLAAWPHPDRYCTPWLNTEHPDETTQPPAPAPARDARPSSSGPAPAERHHVDQLDAAEEARLRELEAWTRANPTGNGEGWLIQRMDRPPTPVEQRLIDKHAIARRTTADMARWPWAAKITDAGEDWLRRHPAPAEAETAAPTAAEPPAVRPLSPGERCALVEVAHKIQHEGTAFPVMSPRFGAEVGSHWTDPALIALNQELKLIQLWAPHLDAYHAFLTDAGEAWLKRYGQDPDKVSMKDLVTEWFGVTGDLEASDRRAAEEPVRYLTEGLNSIPPVSAEEATGPKVENDDDVRDESAAALLAEVRALPAQRAVQTAKQIDPANFVRLLLKAGFTPPFKTDRDDYDLAGEVLDATGNQLVVADPHGEAPHDFARAIAELIAMALNDAAAMPLLTTDNDEEG